MTARIRLRRTAIAVALAVTTGGALLTGCGPTTDGTSSAASAVATTASAAPLGPVGATPSATPSAAPSPSASATPGSAAPSPSAPASPSTAAPSAAATPAAAVNGTAHSALTISDGTRYVLMNGTSVDFGTAVRDLSWSPNGAKAAFIDGSGDLVVANPDGSGRVVVARNPGGQTWSHPAWQVAAADSQYQLQGKNNLFFAVSKDGVSRLKTVPATAVNGTPADLPLGNLSDPDVAPLPTTGNTWPNGGGHNGAAVYANTRTGEVFIRDDYLRQQGSAIAKGSQPAISPDGDDVVFVRSVDGHDHIFELSDHGTTSKDLTPHATTDYTEPSWSPDGRTLAVRTPNGIATLPADGSAAPAQVSGHPGLPAYRGGHR